MPKIDVNKVAEIIKRNEVEPEKLRSIVEEMNLLVQPEVDEEKPPALKKHRLHRSETLRGHQLVVVVGSLAAVDQCRDHSGDLVDRLRRLPLRAPPIGISALNPL